MEIARDGTVYVSDRLNQRIQAFTREGRYLRQAFVDRTSANPQSVSGIAFSHDPAQRHMYVADWGNGLLLVLDRKTLAVVDAFDEKFTGPHLGGDGQPGRALRLGSRGAAGHADRAEGQVGPTITSPSGVWPASTRGRSAGRRR